MYIFGAHDNFHSIKVTEKGSGGGGGGGEGVFINSSQPKTTHKQHISFSTLNSRRLLS